MNRASSPAEGRAVVALMREALVEAKVGLSRVREGVDETRRQLERERTEVATVRRRGRLAAEIRDEETVRLAELYDRKHTDRIAVLERKLAAQEAELVLVEREVEEMTTQFKAAAAGVEGVGGVRASPDLAEPPEPADELRRTIDRAAREAEAERLLEQLKRRMKR